MYLCNVTFIFCFSGKSGAAPKDSGKKQQKKSESEKEPKKQDKKKQEKETEAEAPDAADEALALEPKQKDPFTDIPAG